MTDIVGVSHCGYHVQAVLVPLTAPLYLVWLLVQMRQVYQIWMKQKMLLLISGVECGARDAQIMLMTPEFPLLCWPTRYLLIDII
jgi:hypothetical protein